MAKLQSAMCTQLKEQLFGAKDIRRTISELLFVVHLLFNGTSALLRMLAPRKLIAEIVHTNCTGLKHVDKGSESFPALRRLFLIIEIVKNIIVLNPMTFNIDV